jgi:hypothetical protein
MLVDVVAFFTHVQNLDGPWSIDPEPLMHLEEQIENPAIYYEEGTDTCAYSGTLDPIFTPDELKGGQLLA